MPHVSVPPHVSRQEKMVHNISHEWISMFRQAAPSLSATVPFESGVVSFTSARSVGSHFAEPEAKLNVTFHWQQSSTHTTFQNCKKTGFLSFIGTWYSYNDIALSTPVSHKTLLHKLWNIFHVSLREKRATHTCSFRHTHARRQFPVLMGVMEKRGSCQNSLKALKRLDFQLFLHEVKGSLVLAYDTWANL